MQNVNNNNLNIGLIAKSILRADSSLDSEVKKYFFKNLLTWSVVEKQAWGNIAVNWEIIYVAIPGKHFTHLQLGPYVFGQWHIFFHDLVSVHYHCVF